MDSLAPLLGRAVAERVIDCLGVKPRLPEGSWELGDEELLSAGMLDAADHFGADVKSIPGNHLRRRADKLEEAEALPPSGTPAGQRHRRG